MDATTRQRQLTKPPGSLGELERLAVQLASMQKRQTPRVERICITLFAGDHGVVEEGVSAFPQSVTGQMLRNFASGGAAISVLARELSATLKVIDLGLAEAIAPLQGVTHLNIARGTANFTRKAAMTVAQFVQAMDAGHHAAHEASIQQSDLFIGGEMGIGNSTSACALASVLLQVPPGQLVGPGTGLDVGGVQHKLGVVQTGIELHRGCCDSPVDALTRLGGLEIAALCGSYIAAAQLGLPILVDGYISSVAALCATRISPGTRAWMLFGHRSAEPGHALVLQALDASPLLDLGMRLGEGSGAAVAVPLLRAACALHNQMATFAEAAVSAKQS
ncbi:hypothetical protein LCGC14_0117290 [marine sediment metagenome]|uniref:Nicotinate-nucleotide--dimethylbenzimidazole phosphoribosyltransferase n=1 Tax=marine sediment metagenome TaxID=412755 RepID=A0A0F9VBV6_9ZZZZ